MTLRDYLAQHGEKKKLSDFLGVRYATVVDWGNGKTRPKKRFHDGIVSFTKGKVTLDDITGRMKLDVKSLYSVGDVRKLKSGKCSYEILKCGKMVMRCITTRSFSEAVKEAERVCKRKNGERTLGDNGFSQTNSLVF